LFLVVIKTITIVTNTLRMVNPRMIIFYSIRFYILFYLYFFVTKTFLKEFKLFYFKKKKLAGFGSVRFFRTKTDLTRFFSVWLGFSVWVRFGFRFIKPKPNRTGRFFQNFNWFNRVFFTVRFFWLFFFWFSWFFSFFAIPSQFIG
jgi:hypothetical protein